MQISVIIPMYNESKIIGDTAKALSEYMEKRFDSYEILFSDDGSSDGCGKIVEDLNYPSIRVLRGDVNRGKGYAVRQAMLAAKGDFVIFTDADLAYGTDVIGSAYELWRKKECPQLLLGSRNLDQNGYEGYTFLRRVMSKIYLNILCMIGGLKLSDSQCGCKAFEKEAAKEIFSRCKVDGFAFDFEAILWADQLGFRIEEMSVRIINHRETKIRIVRDTMRMLRDMIHIRKSIGKDMKSK